MKKTVLLFASVVLLSFILTGCSSSSRQIKCFDGEATGGDAQTVHLTYSSFNIYAPVIFKIDGKTNSESNPEVWGSYNSTIRFFNRTPFSVNLQLLPGVHEFEMDTFTGMTVFTGKTMSVKYNFAAGKEYELQYAGSAWAPDGNWKIAEKTPGGLIPVNAVITDVPSYTGPDDSKPHAKLFQDSVPVFDNKTGYAWVYRIDGVPGPKFYWRSIFNDGWNGKIDVNLTPGKHTITYAVKIGDYYSPVPVTEQFNFEAGKKYNFEFEQIKTGDSMSCKVKLKEVQK